MMCLLPSTQTTGDLCALQLQWRYIYIDRLDFSGELTALDFPEQQGSVVGFSFLSDKIVVVALEHGFVSTVMFDQQEENVDHRKVVDMKCEQIFQERCNAFGVSPSKKWACAAGGNRCLVLDAKTMSTDKEIEMEEGASVKSLTWNNDSHITLVTSSHSLRTYTFTPSAREPMPEGSPTSESS